RSRRASFELVGRKDLDVVQHGRRVDVGQLRQRGGAWLRAGQDAGERHQKYQRERACFHAAHSCILCTRRMRLTSAVLVVTCLAAVWAARPDAQAKNLTLTAVAGIKVGHHTLTERPTGCTAILVESGATAGVDVRGAAPASAETDLLKPVNLVQQIYAISLSGGSAFGLDSRSGIMRFLDEKNLGFKAFGSVNVPIVPGASLFDLNVGNNPTIRPTAGSARPRRHPARSSPKATSAPAPAPRSARAPAQAAR